MLRREPLGVVFGEGFALVKIDDILEYCDSIFDLAVFLVGYCNINLGCKPLWRDETAGVVFGEGVALNGGTVCSNVSSCLLF